MKTTLILLVAALAIACSSKNDPSPLVKFNSLAGHWTFDADTVKADFNVIEFQGVLAIDSGGTYTTPAGMDVITHKTPVATGDTPWYIPILKLQGEDEEKLVFTNGEIKDDMSSITFRSFQYVDMGKPSNAVNGIFVVKKVKE